MDITVIACGEGPSYPDYIDETLAGLYPRVFLRWNPRAKERKVSSERTLFDGRYEIWVEVDDNIHPDHRHVTSEDDVYNHEHSCWMRKLQTYQHEDGSYAPIDHRLVRSIRMADTWSREDYYEENVRRPHLQKERADRERVNQLAADAGRYYDNWDKPIIGPHTSGDWRHEIRSITQ